MVLQVQNVTCTKGQLLLSLYTDCFFFFSSFRVVHLDPKALACNKVAEEGAEVKDHGDHLVVK